MPNLIIPPRDLPDAVEVFETDSLVVDNGNTVSKATPVQIVDAGRPWATLQEARAGTASGVSMSPLTTRRAMEAFERNISVFITPQQFGAVADGTTDDFAAIQRAVDAGIATGEAWMLYFPPGRYRISDQIDLRASGADYCLKGEYQLTTILPDAFGPVKACFFHKESGKWTQDGFNITGTTGSSKNDPIGIKCLMSGRSNLKAISAGALGNTPIFCTRPFNADWEGPFDLFFSGWQPLHKDINTGSSGTTVNIAAGGNTVVARVGNTATTASGTFSESDVGKDLIIYQDPSNNEAIVVNIIAFETSFRVLVDRNFNASAANARFSFGPVTAQATGTALTFTRDIGLDQRDVGRMIYIDKAGSSGTTHVTEIVSVTNGGACVLETPVASNGQWRVFFTPTVYIGSHKATGSTPAPNDVYVDKLLIEGFKGPGLLVDGGLHVKIGEMKTHGRTWAEFSNFGQSAEAIIWNNCHKGFISHLELEFCGPPSNGAPIRVAGVAPGLSMGYMSQNAPAVGGYLFDAAFTDTDRGAFVLPQVNGRCNLDRFTGILKTSSSAVRRACFASGRIGGASPVVEASSQLPQIIGSARAVVPAFIASGASFTFRPGTPAGFLSVCADDAGALWGVFKFSSVGVILVNGAANATTTLGTAASLNVAYAGGLITIQNNDAASRRYHIAIQG